MESLPENKAVRLLEIYTHLIKGDVLSKTELATQYHISRRSIQRDMEALRTFIANQNLGQDVVYDYKHRGYRLIQTNPKWLSNSEILAVCKILLESRSLRKDEMLPILDKLVDCAVPDPNKKLIGELIANETFHYIQPHHNKLVLDNLWALGEAVRHQQVVEIEYTRLKDHELVKRRVQPVGAWSGPSKSTRESPPANTSIFTESHKEQRSVRLQPENGRLSPKPRGTGGHSADKKKNTLQPLTGFSCAFSRYII